MLEAINNAVGIYQNLDPKDTPEYSIWKVMRELNTPEMKRGNWIYNYLFEKNYCRTRN